MSKQIVIANQPLTAERARTVLAYEASTGLLRWRITKGPRGKQGEVAGSINGKKRYVRLIIDGVKYLAHRVAWLIVNGEWPTSRLDHENGIKSDNIWDNLRPATNSQNLQNQRKAPANNKSTGLLGVSKVWRSKTFQARITVGRKTKSLGNFRTPQEAHQAYIEAKRQLHPFGEL